MILIISQRVSIYTGTFEDCSRKLEIQRKMYLKVVERSLWDIELIFEESGLIPKFVGKLGFSPRGSAYEPKMKESASHHIKTDFGMLQFSYH